MALDATAGSDSANSYATVKEADELLNTVYGAEEWSLLEPEVKERLLISASRDIDDIPLAYNSVYESQSLNFPIKIDNSTDDGMMAARKACIFQAMYLFDNTDAIREGRTGSMTGIRQETLSSISKTVTGFNHMRRWHPGVLKILAHYSDFSMKIGRG